MLNTNTIKHLAFGSLIVALSGSLVKAFGVFKDIVIAKEFGISTSMDALLLAVSITTFFSVMIGSSLQTTFTPLYLNEHYDRNKIYSSTLTIVFFFFFLFSVFILFVFPIVSKIIFSNNAAEFQSLLYYSLIILAPTLLLDGRIYLSTAVLNIKNRFSVPNLVPGITSILIIVSVSLFSEKFNVYTISVAMLLGLLIEYIVLSKTTHELNFNWPDKALIILILKNTYPLALSSLIMGSTILVDQLMVGYLGDGNITTINYGYRLVMFIATFATHAIVSVTYPHISRCINNNQVEILKRHSIIIISCIIFLSIPSAFIFYHYSLDIIILMFERGKFTQQDSLLVSEVQNCLILVIPFYIISTFLAKIMAATNQQKHLLYISLINLISNIIFNFIFINFFGVKGVAISTVFVYLVSTILLCLSATSVLKKI